jgi:hypothetical protein
MNGIIIVINIGQPAHHNFWDDMISTEAWFCWNIGD